ncbi:hypothetical protein IGI52_002464 [Enterococcus sp. DIV0187]
MNIDLNDIYQTYTAFTKKDLIPMIIAKNEALILIDDDLTCVKNQLEMKNAEILQLKQELESHKQTEGTYNDYITAN